MATKFADFAEYEDSEQSLCEVCGRIISEGHTRCKSCGKKESSARIEARTHERKMRNHRIREFWLSDPPPPPDLIASFLSDLRYQVWCAAQECREGAV